MLRIAICDDMPCFLEQAKDYLLQWSQKPDQLMIDTFLDAGALLSTHNSQPYDIILMDIIMPPCNGIEAARELRQHDKSVKLVFLTSSSDFAVDSYTVKASDYILKPLDPNRLYQCIAELHEQIQINAKSITVKTAKAIHRVEIRSIEYIEAQNKHVLFSLSDGKTILSTEPLYSYENLLLLSDGFFKCNRSYIVNIAHIDTYTTKEIKTRSGCRISISRSCHKEFEAAYFEIIFGKAGDR